MVAEPWSGHALFVVWSLFLWKVDCVSLEPPGIHTITLELLVYIFILMSKCA